MLSAVAQKTSPLRMVSPEPVRELPDGLLGSVVICLDGESEPVA